MVPRPMRTKRVTGHEAHHSKEMALGFQEHSFVEGINTFDALDVYKGFYKNELMDQPRIICK